MLLGKKGSKQLQLQKPKKQSKRVTKKSSKKVTKKTSKKKQSKKKSKINTLKGYYNMIKNI